MPTPRSQPTPRLHVTTAEDAPPVNSAIPKLHGDIRHLIPTLGLRNYWYPAITARKVGRRKPVQVSMLARHGIRVNGLTPTAMDAEEGIERGVAWGRPRPERRSGTLDFRKMVPLGRLPSPHHYARAVVFLASDDGEMVTGLDLRVDAGAIAKYWPWIPHA